MATSEIVCEVAKQLGKSQAKQLGKSQAKRISNLWIVSWSSGKTNKKKNKTAETPWTRNCQKELIKPKVH